MPINVLLKKSFTINKWSGGTTTELFIYPEKSSYPKRNFDFRLSLATVEVEQSDFTPLPGISRKTLILDGAIQIHHEGHHSKQLNKHDVDSYDGGWKTSSEGTCTDFNLMTTGTTVGELEGITLENGEQLVRSGCLHSFIYVHTGRIAVIIHTKAHVVEQGSLFISDDASANVIVKALTESELAIVRILTH